MVAPTTIPGSAAATQTPTSGVAAAPTSVPGCKAPEPSRLVVGKDARVLTPLNFRSAPAIGNNILAVHPTGDVMVVLLGPVCVPYQNSAYLWWQVKSPDGKIGWSAENLLSGNGYYLEPAQ